MSRKEPFSDDVTQAKRLRFAVVLALILIVSTAAAFANPSIKTTWGSYPVNGTSAAALMSEMKTKGPNGFWALTRWYILWTSTCQVSLEINYTMPKHTNRNAMSANLRARWDRMIMALKAHEEQHGAHGINAARELVQKGCHEGDAIVQKWSNQDQVYDQRTNHGRTEGVRLQ